MENEKGKTFARICEKIKNLFNEGCEILIDFQFAAYRPFKDILRMNVYGCSFHMNQAIQKRIGLVGLKEEYIKDIKVHVWPRKLMVLMLIPPEEVKETFEYIKNESLNGIDAVEEKYKQK